MDYDAAKRRLVISKGFVENVTPTMRAYEISSKTVFDHWFSYRRRDRTKPQIGDKRPPAVAIARVLWQTLPTDSLRDEDEHTAMSRHDQLDLFGENPEELPGVERTAAVYRADPDEVRAELLRVLAQVRAAQSLPWDARRTLYWRTVFPQMTNWLPDEEAAQLRFEFETEIRRLEAA